MSNEKDDDKYKPEKDSTIEIIEFKIKKEKKND